MQHDYSPVPEDVQFLAVGGAGERNATHIFRERRKLPFHPVSIKADPQPDFDDAVMGFQCGQAIVMCPSVGLASRVPA